MQFITPTNVACMGIEWPMCIGLQANGSCNTRNRYTILPIVDHPALVTQNQHIGSD